MSNDDCDLDQLLDQLLEEERAKKAEHIADIQPTCATTTVPPTASAATSSTTAKYQHSPEFIEWSDLVQYHVNTLENSNDASVY